LLIYYYAWDCGALCEVFHIVWQIVQSVQKKSASIWPRPLRADAKRPAASTSVMRATQSCGVSKADWG
jgi:hypothetical protein